MNLNVKLLPPSSHVFATRGYKKSLFPCGLLMTIFLVLLDLLFQVPDVLLLWYHWSLNSSRSILHLNHWKCPISNEYCYHVTQIPHDSFRHRRIIGVILTCFLT